MGSRKDIEFAQPALDLLEELELDHEQKIASAHKTPEKVLKILKENEGKKTLYITIAGRSNALSGFVDANTRSPVIACPPYSEKFSGMDILSSLRMPSGVSPLVVLEPKNAALAAAKILALSDSELSEKIASYQQKIKEKIGKK
ncbi:N5-carboxyaminoimidazole ribonucleotide mutase [candidate division MSBL1 archaeon SCGC-AAA385D11]|uniref:N5-carboxyaminoimidazole ribonucleotide mutase n=1 Tax=candidate division MSBL1 archaeon SCGC-AAA385D11 TaxID=1698286 RepID=A0A133VP09_9EURY|nr:N5-carboxyaminoimidazole ribonucleotide mutase [candidate division MSBL1 archaeon SCGC-AAA385D11]